MVSGKGKGQIANAHCQDLRGQEPRVKGSECREPALFCLLGFTCDSSRPWGERLGRGEGASDWPVASQTGEREQEHVPQGRGRKPEARLGAGPTGNRPALRKSEMQSQGGKR